MIRSRVLFDISQISFYSPFFLNYIHKSFAYGSQVVQIFIQLLYLFISLFIYLFISKQFVTLALRVIVCNALNTILFPCEVDSILTSQSATLVTRSTY